MITNGVKTKMLKEYYKLHKSNEELIGLIDVLKEKESKVLNKVIICNARNKPISYKGKNIYGIEFRGMVLGITQDLALLDDLAASIRKKLLKIEEYLDEYRTAEEKENESSTFPLIDKDLLKFKCDLLAKMLSKNAELIYDEDKSVDMYIIQVEDKIKKKILFSFIGNVWDFHCCDLLGLELKLEDLNRDLDGLICFFGLPNRKKVKGLLKNDY